MNRDRCRTCGDRRLIGRTRLCPSCYAAAAIGFRWGAGIAAAIGFAAGVLGWLVSR